jgi:microcin C transport system substrate-binding protein
MAMHGGLLYPKNFKHYSFVNPRAPKGGRIVLGKVGTFDSLNSYVLKGVTATKLPLSRATLVGRSPEEPWAEYCVVAESLEMPEDRSWIIFNLRPEARWHNGKPIRAEDVVFSFYTWLKDGQPFMKTFYNKVEKVEKLKKGRVKFTFKKMDIVDRELPLIMGIMPLIPKDVYEGKDLSKITAEPLVTNGPYRIKKVDFGRSITYERVQNFWGSKLPTYVGRFNFDEVKVEYYRTNSVMFEAFKAGKIDLMEEENPQAWFADYNFPNSKGILKEEVVHNRPVGMGSFVFNTRREIFKDKRVRMALSLIFNFEKLNASLYHGAYSRTNGFFDNTELEPKGRPKGAELKILNGFKSKLDPSVFGVAYKAPFNGTPEAVRHNLQMAQKLLKEAGWVFQDGSLVDKGTKRPFAFEILLDSTEHEKSALAFARNCSALGILATVRFADGAQYERRKVDFDYDMIHVFWAGTRSPGNELWNYVSTKAASTNGSRNYPGIVDPVIDEIIKNIVTSRERATLVANTKVLDRILMAGNYVVPLYHLKKDMIAYWKGFQHPRLTPNIESRIESWWHTNPL